MTEEQKQIILFYDYLLEESIEHYERMLQYAICECDENDDVYKYAVAGFWGTYMSDNISEDWHSYHCVLCECFSNLSNDCKKCPLEIFGENCDISDSLWKRMANTAWNGNWIYGAEDMLELLKDIRKVFRRIK